MFCFNVYFLWSILHLSTCICRVDFNYLDRVCKSPKPKIRFAFSQNAMVISQGNGRCLVQNLLLLEAFFQKSQEKKENCRH